jgi:hypothetical protein
MNKFVLSFQSMGFTMAKLSVSMAVATLALAAHAQSNAAPVSAGPAGSDVLRFVGDTYNCDKMLGRADDGDQLPAAYSVALNASLNEIKAPADQAIAKIYARCMQHVSTLNQVSMK